MRLWMSSRTIKPYVSPATCDQELLCVDVSQPIFFGRQLSRFHGFANSRIGSEDWATPGVPADIARIERAMDTVVVFANRSRISMAKLRTQPATPSDSEIMISI